MKKLFAVIIMCLFASVNASGEEPEKFTSGDYEYVLLDDGTAGIRRYLGQEEILDIPDQLDGYSVTTIKKFAFHDCDSISSIILPDNLTAIGGGAFASCSSLSSITLPSSLTTIGDQAFACCDSLSSITLPDSLTTIGYQAFYGCEKLTFTVSSDTYAAEYCEKNGLNWHIKDSASEGNILAEGDEFVLLSIDEDGFYEGDRFLKIISTNGETIFDHLFQGIDLKYVDINDAFCYIGCGVFCIDRNKADLGEGITCLNCYTKDTFDIADDKLRIASQKTFINGSTLLFTNDYPYDILPYEDRHEKGVVLVSATDGIIGDIHGPDFYQGSNIIKEDKYIYTVLNEVSSKQYSQQLKWYDCTSGEVNIIPFKDIDKLNSHNLCFNHGLIEVELIGADGDKYNAVINKEGKYIVEPTKEYIDFSALSDDYEAYEENETELSDTTDQSTNKEDTTKEYLIAMLFEKELKEYAPSLTFSEYYTDEDIWGNLLSDDDLYCIYAEGVGEGVFELGVYINMKTGNARLDLDTMVDEYNTVPIEMDLW